MNFADIPTGSSVCLDANVLIYAFGSDPIYGSPSKTLLDRIEQGDVDGFLTSHAFSDTAHRMMTLEACQILGWSYTGIGRRLRRNPAEIQKLQAFRKALDDIVAIGLHILPVSDQDILLAGDLSIQHGLLSGDALMIAMMQKNGLTQLASNDADFDHVPGLTRFGPV